MSGLPNNWQPPTLRRLPSPEPTQAERVVSKKLLPAVSALRTSSTAGENEYQTVCTSLGEIQGGSPGSEVAVVLSTPSLKGKFGMTVALAKSSFTGWARAWGAATKIRARTPVETMSALNLVRVTRNPSPHPETRALVLRRARRRSNARGKDHRLA